MRDLDRDTQAAKILLVVTVATIVLAFSIVPPLARQWRAAHATSQQAAR